MIQNNLSLEQQKRRRRNGEREREREREREKRWRKEMSENDDELDKLVQAEKIGSTIPTYLPTYLLQR